LRVKITTCCYHSLDKAEQRLAADCLQRPLRSRFRQQLKAGVRLHEREEGEHCWNLVFTVVYHFNVFALIERRSGFERGKFASMDIEARWQSIRIS
jgi:hypothetical protein